MKEVRSSLDGLTFDLSVRRSGKTRRIIDNAINILYEDGMVLVQDHDREDGGKSNMMHNDYLAKVIWRRLVIEGGFDKSDFKKHFKNGVLKIKENLE